MAKNLYNLTAVTTVNDSDLLHVNQGSVSSDKKVTKANLLKEVNSSITSLNNSLANSSKYVHVTGNCGALTENARGYTSVSITVPSGYKTTGLYSVSYNHPAAEGNAGLNLGASFAKRATGTITVFIVYNTIGALSAANSDFELHVHCVPEDYIV